MVIVAHLTEKFEIQFVICAIRLKKLAEDQTMNILGEDLRQWRRNLKADKLGIGIAIGLADISTVR
jgi:hypothetical protein